jgi:hypothetical protein
LDQNAKSFYKCFLNNDTIGDYAIALTTGKDSSLIEYFVALVSHDEAYSVFILDSNKAQIGACERYLFITPAGKKMNIFGDYDGELYSYGEMDSNKVYIKFPTDCVLLQPIGGGTLYSNFVFINGRFIEISSAD